MLLMLQFRLDKDRKNDVNALFSIAFYFANAFLICSNMRGVNNVQFLSCFALLPCHDIITKWDSIGDIGQLHSTFLYYRGVDEMVARLFLALVPIYYTYCFHFSTVPQDGQTLLFPPFPSQSLD